MGVESFTRFHSLSGPLMEGDVLEVRTQRKLEFVVALLYSHSMHFWKVYMTKLFVIFL